MLKAALDYHAQGFIVIPIIKGKKSPLITGWQREGPQDEARVRALFRDDDVDIGIVCGTAARLVAVDVDVKPGQLGAKSLAAWGDLPATRTHSTPSGGAHLFYRLPEGFSASNPHCMGPGIDVQCDGRQVVAPPTAGYLLHVDAPIAPCPPKLLAALATKKAAESQAHEDDLEPGPLFDHRVAWYTKWLRDEAPARGEARRGKGDATLFEVVQQGAWDCLLPTATVLELVREHYDPRCQPPWGDELEERVHHKSHQAKTVSTRPRSPPPDPGELELVDVIRGAAPDVALPKLPKPDAVASHGFEFTWSQTWRAPPDPPKYLIDTLLVQGSVCMVYAEPGSIKSWTSLDMARCVATGRPWLGQYAVDHGKCLYVDWEDAEQEFRRRLWLLNGNTVCHDIAYLYHPGYLNDPKSDIWRRLAELIQAQGFKLVVFDTLGGSQPGEDENDTRAAAGLKTAGLLATTTGVTCVWNHHSNRQGSVRGTSAFKADVDLMMKLDTIEDDEIKHRAKLYFEKSGQKKPKAICLELTDAGLHTFKEEEKAKATSMAEDPESLDNRILLILKDQGPISGNRLERLVKGKRQAVQMSLKILEEEQLICKVLKGWKFND